MTKRQKINELQKKIDKAQASADQARDLISENGFQMEDIEEYNRRLGNLGELNIKMRFLSRTTPAEQYLDEIKIPGHIQM